VIIAVKCDHAEHLNTVVYLARMPFTAMIRGQVNVVNYSGDNVFIGCVSVSRSVCLSVHSALANQTSLSYKMILMKFVNSGSFQDSLPLGGGIS